MEVQILSSTPKNLYNSRWQKDFGVYTRAMMESFNEPQGSGYEGPGFKYSGEEFNDEVDKLVTRGMDLGQARDAVIEKEAMARERQRIAQEEKAPRWVIGSDEESAA